MILLDTNVLVYALNSSAPQHPASRAVVEATLEGRLEGVLVPQVLTETYAVVTDPRRVERPLEPGVAWGEIESLRFGCTVLEWRDEALDALGRLLAELGIRGQDVFDTLLVAQMEAHGVRRMCTYDMDGFRGFPGVDPVRPEDVRLGGRRG